MFQFQISRGVIRSDWSFGWISCCSAGKSTKAIFITSLEPRQLLGLDVELGSGIVFLDGYTNGSSGIAWYTIARICKLARSPKETGTCGRKRNVLNLPWTGLSINGVWMIEWLLLDTDIPQAQRSWISNG
jgi:hypothetical protein